MREAEVFVLDALGGLARLTRRSPTLDGALPLRAAQGCTPLLDGNAYGLQVFVDHPVRLTRGASGWSARWVLPHETSSGWGLDAPERPRLPAWESLCAAALPALRARGLLSPAWCDRLAGGPLWVSRRWFRTSRAALWTGLLARPAEGLALRVLRGANRRPLGLSARPYAVTDASGWTPLLLDLDLDDGRDEVVLAGEVATLGVFDPRAVIARAPLDGSDEARALLDFYDAEYFAAKRAGRVTRKYRREVGADGDGLDVDGRLTVLGGLDAEVTDAPPERIEGPGGLTREGATVARVTVRNAVAFTARYDGHTVSLDWDRAALARRRAAIESQWAWATAAEPDAHRGALWYLTKYFTPHPAGEPHAFVKPAALFSTPRGWSTLVEGVAGAGYDVLRGVVRTDGFHAAPAVLAFTDVGARVRVPEGEPLAELCPAPRALLAPRASVERFTLA